MQTVISFLSAHAAEIFGTIYIIISEIMSTNEKIKSNSLLQLIFNILKDIAKKYSGK